MRVLITSLRVSALTLAVRAAVAVKEIMVAGLFGAGDMLDTFIAASFFPVFAINVLVSSLGVALIPRLAQLDQNHGPDSSYALASRMTLGLTGVLMVLAAVLAICAPVLVAILYPGFDANKVGSTVMALRILVATIPLSGLAAIWSGLLTLQKRYTLVGLAPAFTPLLTVALLLYFRTRLGVIPMAFGILMGTFLEVVLLGAVLRWTGVPIVFSRDRSAHVELVQLLRQYAPVVIGTLFSSATILVDQTMASGLGPAQLSSLSIGSKITGITLSILSTGLGMVLLPRFSVFAAKREWSELRVQHSRICRQLSLASIPVAFVLAYFAPQIIGIVFERGAFRSADTLAVSRIQIMYALQIPFFLIGIVTARLLSALSGNHFLMWIGALNLLVSVAANFVFRAYFGTPGIALSSSVVQVVSSILLLLAASSLLRRTESSMLRVQG